MAKTKSSAARGPLGEDHTQALVKLIHATAHRWSPHVVFSDFVEMACLSFSNAVDRPQAEAREARYLEIAGKYPKSDLDSFPRMLAHLALALEACCIVGELDDVLGRVYMQLELGNDRAGQFFTPIHISRFMALVLVGDGAQAREKGFIDVLEPACGAGGMVLAVADALRQAGLNYQRALHATCIDIDARCAHMCYLQLSLLHIPAIVLHGNSLTDEVWSRWYTPAHVVGGWRARLAVRRQCEPMPVTAKEVPRAAAPPSSSSSKVPPDCAGPVGRVEQLRLFDA